MKHYIVYLNGIEKAIIKAGSFGMAEKKATRLFNPDNKFHLNVVYTEI